jgi:hypothetical protein
VDFVHWQGKNQRASAVDFSVNEHCEPVFNAAREQKTHFSVMP